VVNHLFVICPLKITASEIFRHVFWWMSTNVSMEHAASIFRTGKQGSRKNSTVVAKIGQESGPRATNARRWIIVALKKGLTISWRKIRKEESSTVHNYCGQNPRLKYCVCCLWYNIRKSRSGLCLQDLLCLFEAQSLNVLIRETAVPTQIRECGVLLVMTPYHACLIWLMHPSYQYD
jgi:hypothetical protein